MAADSKALAAENARLVAQNEAALGRMRELAAALERQQEGGKVGASANGVAPAQQRGTAQQTQPEQAAGAGAAAEGREADCLRTELADVSTLLLGCCRGGEGGSKKKTSLSPLSLRCI